MSLSTLLFLTANDKKSAKRHKKHPNRLANYTTLINGIDSQFISNIKSDGVEGYIDEFFNDYRYDPYYQFF